MENKNEFDFSLPEDSTRSLFSVYFKIIIVPVLIYLVFLAGYFDVINFKVELHSILMMGFLLFMALIFARHSAEYGCCLFEDQILVFKSGLKDYIMNHLTVVGNKKKSNATFENFISDFTNGIRNKNYSSVAAGVFPMLGILGTFISIAISMPQFSSSDINSLESEISQLLGGVGTAFYVSIFGIFLALWWIYFEKKGISRFEKLMFKYKTATKIFFWDKDEISQNLMQEILNQNKKMVNSFENALNTEFIKNLSNALNDEFETFKNMVNYQKKALEISSNGLKEVNEKIYKFEKSSSNLNSDLENSILKTNKLNLNLEETYINLSKLFEANHKFLEKNSLNFNSSIQILKNEIEEFKKALLNINSQILNLHNQSMQNFKNSLQEDIDNFKNLIIKESRKIDNSDIIEELKKSLENIDLNSKFINNLEADESR
ncbi:hypothetical protein F1B92_08075 [Campylobacter sp. FMV-PI01]|uniref:MotA/TolQ/ExbB proton channel domain-containing protein n=1 Tax=Campylobacter portucalensis TaxID=2608384 RepID=A0A6L5WM84_9BACT|nr:MotA/TolQ/ExbB proton channel family protein [Campylobacter portucalensis]MSN97115.1 hypothetical protein [Campylobacter portucalensis]